MNVPVITNLRQPFYLAWALAVVIATFDASLYVMRSFFGGRHDACAVGGALTPLNIIFSSFYSLLFGVFIAGAIASYRNSSGQRTRFASSLSAISALIAFFTYFCALCTVPALSLIGASVLFAAVSEYSLLFQIASVLLLICGLYIINTQLLNTCTSCGPRSVRSLPARGGHG